MSLRTVKDDVCLIQVKLVNRTSQETLNTLSFVNLPQSRHKARDPNLQALEEIIKVSKFMPYNKSLLTRVMFDQLQHRNLHVVAHYSRQYLQQAQPASYFQAL